VYLIHTVKDKPREVEEKGGQHKTLGVVVVGAEPNSGGIFILTNQYIYPLTKVTDTL